MEAIVYVVPENIYTQPQDPGNKVGPAHIRSFVILKSGGTKCLNTNRKTTRKQEH